MKLKQLEWRKLESGEHYVAAAPWRSDYWINMPEQGFGEGQYLATFNDWVRDSWREVCPSLGEAMAACQRNHESRTLALFDTAEKENRP